MEMRAGLDRLRDEALVILTADFFGMIRKADVEMGLEDQMHTLFGHFHSIGPALPPSGGFHAVSAQGAVRPPRNTGHPPNMIQQPAV
jgi:hypothetical protein